MPQYYTVEQGKNTEQQNGRTELGFTLTETNF